MYIVYSITGSTKEKHVFKTLFHLRIDGAEKDRNKAGMKECKKTTGHVQKICSRWPVVFLQSFISALFLSFFPLHCILKWSEVLEKLLSLVSVPFRGFYKWESLVSLDLEYGSHVTIVTKKQVTSLPPLLFMYSKPLPFAGTVQHKNELLPLWRGRREVGWPIGIKQCCRIRIRV